MSRFTRLIVFLIAIGAIPTLVGCTTSYHFAPEEKTAFLKCDAKWTTLTTTNGAYVPLDPQAGSCFKIPADQPLRLEMCFRIVSLGTTYRYAPWLVFVPDENEVYICDYTIIGNLGHVELAMEDANSLTGLRPARLLPADQWSGP